MLHTPIPFNESARLKALQDLEILDTPPEPSYDEIVELVAQICEVPIALISLIDHSRQWFKAKVGLDVDETAREFSFCAHCIMENKILEVRDASLDERFADNPLVTGEPHIRFYAGAPLYTESGIALGSLCVIDRKPRQLTDLQRNALLVLSNQVSAKMELRWAHKQLLEEHAQLEVAHDSLQSLFQIIAHDLRSPFNGLLGVTELLAKDLDSFSDADVQDLLTTLNESASETYVMLENLLEWANFEAGSVRFRPRALPALGLVNAAVCTLSTVLGRKHLELKVSVPDGVSLLVDEAMVASVVRNLTSNAIKFTPENGTITISAQIQENGLRIEVADNGTGMTAEQVEAILRNTHQQSSVGTNGERGSGIGLKLIHQFLAKHASRLELVSQVGIGTTASFVLPIA
ncbi:MAG: GAF domain-containing sensor histidine kinase [Opitutaceae bacterium]